MLFPQRGDRLIRSLPADRFELVDVVSLQFIAGPFDGLRPLGDPFRLPAL